MLKSWSRIVLILSLCTVVVPAPVPQLAPGSGLPFNNAFGLGPVYNNNNGYSLLPGQMAVPKEVVNPRNPFGVANAGLPGGINIFGKGLIETGVNLTNAIQSAVNTVTTTLGSLFSGIFSDGAIHDRLSFYPPFFFPNISAPTNATPPAAPVTPTPLTPNPTGSTKPLETTA